MNIKVSLLASVVIGLLSAGSAHALVINGDFNAGGTTATTTVSGWTVTSGDVDVKDTAFWKSLGGAPWLNLLNAKPGNADAGDHFLDLSGNGPGAISQSLATTAGTAYSLSFDFAANPSAVNTASFEVSLTWGSGSTSQVLDGSNSWNVGSLNFTPDGATTVAFRSLTPLAMADGPEKRSGALLDNIAVAPEVTAFSSFNVDPNSLNGNVAPVPEPETYAMMLLGLGAIGFVARRRQRTAA